MCQMLAYTGAMETPSYGMDFGRIWLLWVMSISKGRKLQYFDVNMKDVATP